MTHDRRSDRPASRTIHAGQSITLHGVRIDCVSIDGETCRLRVWRETVVESTISVDIPQESATK